jgi:hypothetical protein
MLSVAPLRIDDLTRVSSAWTTAEAMHSSRQGKKNPALKTAFLTLEYIRLIFHASFASGKTAVRA